MSEFTENTIEGVAGTPAQVTAGKPQEILDYYDGTKRKRFEFVIVDGNTKYDTAHVFEPITDERWMKFLRDQRVRGNADNVESNDVEAIISLWDDLIVEVENVELPPDTNLEDQIGFGEKKDAVEHYVSVAAFDPDTDELSTSAGVRKLNHLNMSRVVLTEAFQDGKVFRQEHTLRVKTVEDIKRYESILRRRFKQEATKGLRKSPKIEFIPQDDKFAKLYDDMLIKTTGFANLFVPMRFKVAVIHHLFASELDEKKS